MAALIENRRTNLKQMMKDWEHIETTLEEPSQSEESVDSLD